MSLSSRKELLERIQSVYAQSSYQEKNQVLTAFVQATGYRRKYAITLLNQTKESKQQRCDDVAARKKIYDNEVLQAFITVWRAANEICPKRLIPFLPKFVESLEKHGHLSLTPSTRQRLLKMSAATADRLLRSERTQRKKSISTTRPGALLKKQIPIRTFSDWNDVTPGFVEADLVAHCGDRANGAFLNTLTMTDIATGWTELIPLIRKSEADVQKALENIRCVLPFKLLGLDTDNGSEFINYELKRFCEEEQITFTRARAYRKNDQAHVEEKNGSIVRRMVGYDRYEGLEAWRALAALYAKLRLYVNFFQPSQKLINKRREGSKTIKQYDRAKTPCQRLCELTYTTLAVKAKLESAFTELDPVTLLSQIQKLQDELAKHAWKTATEVSAPSLVAETIASIYENPEPRALRSLPVNFRRTKKPRKKMAPRTHRTRKDPFETAWSEIQLKLELDPSRTAKELLQELVTIDPNLYKMNQRRTLQRRIFEWRQRQLELEAEHKKITLRPDTTIQIYTELTELALSR